MELLYKGENGNIDNQIKEKIEQFVESRNNLFHKHNFASENPDKILNELERQKGVDLEIRNIQLFIPLLLATILGYQGKYWDSIQNKFMMMPR